MNSIKNYLKQTNIYKKITDSGFFDSPDNEDLSLVRIDLGCGKRKVKGCIGVDQLQLPGVDIVHDLNRGLPFDDNSVDIIYANGILGLLDLRNTMSEIHRVLKKDSGKVRVFVHHFSNSHACSDILWKNNFGYLTMDYFVKTENQKSGRKVPDMLTPCHFKINKKELVFTSEFLILKFPAKLFQYLINKSDTLLRLYEYNFCHIYPAYGIRVEMKPDR